MQYKDLDWPTQIVLVALLTVLMGSVIIRAAAFLSRTLARVPRLYPSTWTTAQCQLMDRFRVLVGLMLSALWIALLFAAPHMPTNWPFGFLEVTCLLALLLLTNAWLVLLLPRNWTELGRLTSRFAVTISVLILWWGLMFSGTAWILVRAATPMPPRIIPGPVFAVLKPPIMAWLAFRVAVEGNGKRDNVERCPSKQV